MIVPAPPVTVILDEPASVISSNEVAPVPPLAMPSVPVTSLVLSDKSIVTSNLPPEKFKAVDAAKSIANSSAAAAIPSPPITFSVLPVFVIPEPAVIAPPPENCVNAKFVVPTVIAPLVDNTKPLSAFTVPSSTNAKAPEVTSASESKSVALVGAPDALTV
ncbi:MAG: hypothetical protein CBC05_02470 [Crocinitomicaceae bacterium TMED45]|nr:MAG: hypothetical protein CBC05_02470 [Crocinitomicaceae bacterium TMED45]